MDTPGADLIYGGEGVMVTRPRAVFTVADAEMVVGVPHAAIIFCRFKYHQAGVVTFNSARDLTPDLMDSAQTQIDIRLHFVGVQCFAGFQDLMISAGSLIIGALFKLNITDMQ
jgi:hypothetical protein